MRIDERKPGAVPSILERHVQEQRRLPRTGLADDVGVHEAVVFADAVRSLAVACVRYFGHGKKHLSTVSAYLMMLAFLIDQCQQRGCALFQAARHKAERARYFWERLRVLFLDFRLPDWETLYRAIAFGYHGELVLYDTS